MQVREFIIADRAQFIDEENIPNKKSLIEDLLRRLTQELGFFDTEHIDLLHAKISHTSPQDLLSSLTLQVSTTVETSLMPS